MMIPVLMYYQI